MLNSFFKHVQEDLGIELTLKQQNQFDDYFKCLIEYNKKVNLTRITDEEEVYYKHFYDSLTMLKSINLKGVVSLCDMGAGAGFPSIPLKIINPNLKVTIIDSLGKRINFLKKLIEVLNISDVELIYNRIEVYAQNHKNKFDIVTARALGALPLILELGLPMVKEGKSFVAYKGSNYQEEINVSKHALDILKAEIVDVKVFELPESMGYRSHIIIKKIKHVDGYPRSFATIKKHPL